MIRIRRASERGTTRTAWLESRHTFAFGDYRDPAQLGFANLRVINDDVVAPGGGFAPHGHREMEIVTLVLAGALAHRDSLGSAGVIRAGEVQRMSAGTGITHSELNASQSEPVHFLQIWIEPERLGAEPGYEQRALPAGAGLHRIASPASPAALRINAQCELDLARLASGEPLTFAPARSRRGWLQVVRGELALAGFALGPGDGAALDGEREVELVARSASEVLLFELR